MRMAEGCQRESWSRFSSLMALVANCHRDPKKSRELKPRDFDPFPRRRPEPKLKMGIGILREVFCRKPPS